MKGNVIKYCNSYRKNYKIPPSDRTLADKFTIYEITHSMFFQRQNPERSHLPHFFKGVIY